MKIPPEMNLNVPDIDLTEMEFSGKLIIDDGAANALKTGKSFLAAGVTRMEGSFSRGDVVSIVTLNGREIGCGIVSYDAGDAEKILGCRSEEIEKRLGFEARGAIIHRDFLVMNAANREMETHNA